MRILRTFYAERHRFYIGANEKTVWRSIRMAAKVDHVVEIARPRALAEAIFWPFARSTFSRRGA
jgi:hypothetical protein